MVTYGGGFLYSGLILFSSPLQITLQPEFCEGQLMTSCHTLFTSPYALLNSCFVPVFGLHSTHKHRRRKSFVSWHKLMDSFSRKDPLHLGKAEEVTLLATKQMCDDL